MISINMDNKNIIFQDLLWKKQYSKLHESKPRHWKTWPRLFGTLHLIMRYSLYRSFRHKLIQLMCSFEKLAYRTRNTHAIVLSCSRAIHTVSVSDRNCWADSLRRLCVEMTRPVSRRDCESEFTNLFQLSLSLSYADAVVDDYFVEKVLQRTLRCDQWLLFELLWRDLLTVGFDRGKSLGWYCQLEYHTLNVTDQAKEVGKLT